MIELLNKLKCKLGFHDFKFSHGDLRFMPKVRILNGKCSHCLETQSFIEFFDSEKVVVRNHGINRIFGEYTVMPLEEKQQT